MKKEITFIYKDDVQKQVYEQIAVEAKKRGYRTKITDDRYAKCEIGWYCEHINFPQFSKFSVIMLHDITQQYGNWPDVWMREPWNKYDVGFLPSSVWVDNWNQCSQYYYANPKRGMYLTGWPKADRISEYLDESKKKAYAESVGIDISKPTILYAPAWENDNKQDEFVQSMKELDVNILVKQAPWPDSYQEQLRNIAEMYKLHKDDPRVIIMDPKTSILDAIMISDVLVSEESSTMCESVMMGKPAVSVCDWMIPEGDDRRPPADDYDFVVKTVKAELTSCVKDIVDNYDKYQSEAQKYSDEHFANIGNCIPMMLDIIDDVARGRESRVKALKPRKRQMVPFKKKLQHFSIIARREIGENYCMRNPVLKKLMMAYFRWRGYIK